MNKRQCGFTLIEVMVTLVIMALILMALQVTLQSTLYTHDEIAVEMAAVREGPAILDLIERDLSSLHCYNIKDNQVLAGKSFTLSGMSGDRLDFLSGSDSSIRMQDPSTQNSEEPITFASDVTEVGYRLRENPSDPDFLELYRREDVFVDEEPLEGGRYERLHDAIRTFKVSYLPELGEDVDVEEEWDMKERKKLPAAVVVELELQSHPEIVAGFLETQDRAQFVHRYKRVIPIHSVVNDTFRIRPALPVKIDENAMGPGGGGGGGGDGAGSIMAGGGGMPGGGGEGEGEKDAGDTRGGTMIDGMGDQGERTHIDFDGSGSGEINLNPDDLGNLSDEDRDMLEEFMNEYKGRYGGGGGNPFGG